MLFVATGYSSTDSLLLNTDEDEVADESSLPGKQSSPVEQREKQPKEGLKPRERKRQQQFDFEKIIDTFSKQQQDTCEKFMEWEENRTRREAEEESRRRQEFQRHEMKLFSLIANSLNPSNYNDSTSSYHSPQFSPSDPNPSWPACQFPSHQDK